MESEHELRERLLKTPEARELIFRFCQGELWDDGELTGEECKMFDELGMDYRTEFCFINSPQVTRYVKKKYEGHEDKDIILSALEKMRPCSTERHDLPWSNAADIACESLHDIPPLADPVLYLVYLEFRNGRLYAEDAEDFGRAFDDFYNIFFDKEHVPVPALVHFIGELSEALVQGHWRSDLDLDVSLLGWYACEGRLEEILHKASWSEDAIANARRQWADYCEWFATLPDAQYDSETDEMYVLESSPDYKEFIAQKRTLELFNSIE